MTGRTLDKVCTSRSGYMLAMQLLSRVAIQPNLELKTWPKQLLGSLLLDIALNCTPVVVSGIKIIVKEWKTLTFLVISHKLEEIAIIRKELLSRLNQVYY